MEHKLPSQGISMERNVGNKQPMNTNPISEARGSSQMKARQPLSTMSSQGGNVANEKRKQVAISNVTPTMSTQNEIDHGVKKKQSICPATTIHEFLAKNDIVNQEEELEYEEELEDEDENSIDQDFDQEDEEIIGTSKKRTRGKTECKSVHARSLEEREEIIFEEGVAVGPNDQSLNLFRSFLGTISRNTKFCPLNYTNFQALVQVHKETILTYIRSKYIFPVEGEPWVLIGVRESWRRHKSYIKKIHFTPYENTSDMLKNRLEDIPLNIFKQWIAYWKIPTVQRLNKMNSANRKLQKWNHRMGRVNFARVRKRLREANETNEDVNQVELFVATRMGAKGKDLDPETKSAIDNVQDRIENSGENPEEAFEAVFGKERPGRIRGYERGVTKTSLKMQDEINALNRKHLEEISTLKVEMDDQMEVMQKRLDDQNVEIDGLKNAMKILLEKSNVGMNFDDLMAAVGSQSDANSAPNVGKNGFPRSSTSTHDPNEILGNMSPDEA